MPEFQQTQRSKKTNTIFQNQATPVRQTPASNPYSIIQRAKINPRSLTRADIMQLQRTIGNQAVGRLLSSIGSSSTAQQATVQRQEIPEEETCPSCMQRQEIPEEEEPLQGKMTETLQRQEIPEEEEPLQGKMIRTIQRQEIPEEEEPLQGKFENNPEISCPSCSATPIVQRQEIPEEEEPLQGKFESIQRQEIPEEEEPLKAKTENNTGMPDNLKAGVEGLSGIDMSDVRVHYNSDKPAEVGALAYTQGTNIHIAPGQERHLPHEAWHIVQQAQGRVKPTFQMKGVAVNDDKGLESEADIMGNRAVELRKSNYNVHNSSKTLNMVIVAMQKNRKHTNVKSYVVQMNPWLFGLGAVVATGVAAFLLDRCSKKKSSAPTSTPTKKKSSAPTLTPTKKKSSAPTSTPTKKKSSAPTSTPTKRKSSVPTPTKKKETSENSDMEDSDKDMSDFFKTVSDYDKALIIYKNFTAYQQKIESRRTEIPCINYVISPITRQNIQISTLTDKQPYSNLQNFLPTVQNLTYTEYRTGGGMGDAGHDRVIIPSSSFNNISRWFTRGGTHPSYPNPFWLAWDGSEWLLWDTTQKEGSQYLPPLEQIKKVEPPTTEQMELLRKGIPDFIGAQGTGRPAIEV